MFNFIGKLVPGLVKGGKAAEESGKVVEGAQGLSKGKKLINGGLIAGGVGGGLLKGAKGLGKGAAQGVAGLAGRAGSKALGIVGTLVALKAFLTWLLKPQTQNGILRGIDHTGDFFDKTDANNMSGARKDLTVNTKDTAKHGLAAGNYKAVTPDYSETQKQGRKAIENWGNDQGWTAQNAQDHGQKIDTGISDGPDL